MNDGKYFGLTPPQLNLTFFAVVGAVALAGFVYFGGVSAVQGLFGNSQPSQKTALEEPPTPVATQPASTECSQLVVGCDALVTNTGTPLNLRDTPSMNGTIISRLQDGTAVAIKGGPTQSDGYVWWQILASGSLGWAAEGDAYGTKWLVPIVAGSSEFGPDVVWITLADTGDALWNALRDGDDGDVVEVMLRYGASAQAVEFYKETGLFATSFTEEGKVDAVETTLPGRANSLADTALVNGSPRILVVDEIDLTSLAIYPPYTEIAAAIDITGEAYQDEYLSFRPWTPDIGLLEITASPTGGQAFVFRVPLTDGCHACPIGYEGFVAHDFAPDGTYEGWRALEPCAKLGKDTYVDVGAELCETQPCVPPSVFCYVWVTGDFYDSPGGEVMGRWDKAIVDRLGDREGQDWWLLEGHQGPQVWVTADSIIRPVEVGGLPCVTGTVACITSP